MREPTKTYEGYLLDETIEMTLDELCHVCEVHREVIITLVEEGLLEPSGDTPAHWYFSGSALPRLQRALRLQRDLDLNPPGAALAIQLLEEIEALRARLHALEKGLPD